MLEQPTPATQTFPFRAAWLRRPCRAAMSVSFRDVRQNTAFSIKIERVCTYTWWAGSSPPSFSLSSLLIFSAERHFRGSGPPASALRDWEAFLSSIPIVPEPGEARPCRSSVLPRTEPAASRQPDSPYSPGPTVTLIPPSWCWCQSQPVIRGSSGHRRCTGWHIAAPSVCRHCLLFLGSCASSCLNCMEKELPFSLEKRVTFQPGALAGRFPAKVWSQGEGGHALSPNQPGGQ